MEVDPEEQQIDNHSSANDSNVEDEKKIGVENLALDYSEIAMLVQKLNTQMQAFTTTMNDMVDSVPSHVNLCHIWNDIRSGGATEKVEEENFPSSTVNQK
mmetsp:Transcript_8348/g.12858  ORF Transcript_8348/g.12858 Transcript_8348/m.12858 type:complete len:100 (+) Transcript_8348:74-373(+)|eukprot:CAMPEP_0178897208 /NCGR_PEP_ID=MMETSP0786-20121207/1617_1 /TAXON_ID=186022 /ORGANISM="Thalassionema frauenfeldii, Strain CCMP 1798" /LENGTH=99 /DNA_ID=CAMNT_0020567729 /DNA_START=6 /DNA_END=305 /DNA_ORIENTATION=+